MSFQAFTIKGEYTPGHFELALVVVDGDQNKAIELYCETFPERRVRGVQSHDDGPTLVGMPPSNVPHSRPMCADGQHEFVGDGEQVRCMKCNFIGKLDYKVMTAVPVEPERRTGSGPLPETCPRLGEAVWAAWMSDASGGKFDILGWKHLPEPHRVTWQKAGEAAVMEQRRFEATKDA